MKAGDVVRFNQSDRYFWGEYSSKNSLGVVAKIVDTTDYKYACVFVRKQDAKTPHPAFDADITYTFLLCELSPYSWEQEDI